MAKVIAPGSAVDDDVIEVSCSVVCSVVSSIVEDNVHHTLKGCRCSLETEWHDSKLEQAIRSSESSLWLILLPNRDLPVATGVVMNLASPKRSMRSSILGIGYASAWDTMFNRW